MVDSSHPSHAAPVSTRGPCRKSRLLPTLPKGITPKVSGLSAAKVRCTVELEGWLRKGNSMSERQWSLADRFVFVANEIARMNDDVDNENPHRYPLRKMKQTAEKILFEAMTTATL